ncbi:MAG: hypothetical protein KJN99_02230 [Marinicaulis sp.]|nr:hypothetical protein [Marinicaulis sp.]
MFGIGIDRRGNIALLAALLLPVILGFAGAGFDYVRYAAAISEFQ